MLKHKYTWTSIQLLQSLKCHHPELPQHHGQGVAKSTDYIEPPYMGLKRQLAQ